MTPRPPVRLDETPGDMADVEQFRLVIRRDGKGGAPTAIRLRRLLKTMLRSFGLRCVAIEPHQENRP